MNTFGCGKYVVCASSIAEGRAIVQALEDSERRSELHEFLRQHDCFHQFGYHRVCECGVSKLDYIDAMFSQQLSIEHLCCLINPRTQRRWAEDEYCELHQVRS